MSINLSDCQAGDLYNIDPKILIELVQTLRGQLEFHQHILTEKIEHVKLLENKCDDMRDLLIDVVFKLANKKKCKLKCIKRNVSIKQIQIST